MKSLLKRKKLIAGILIVVIIVLFVRSGNSAKSKTVPMRKLSVENRTVVKTVSASGEVKSVNQADLSFPAGQRITSVNVKKGDVVKKGTLLATIESQGIYQTAKSYKDARDVALRQKELFVRNEDSNKDLLGGEDQYNIKLREYDEAISQAEASYNAQYAALRNTALYAPFEGTVIDVTKDIGETTTAGEVVIKLADLSKVQFEIGIDQEDYGQLKNGMTAQINLDAYPNYSFSGTVNEIPLYASSSSFTAKVDFDNVSDKKPLLGMTGDVKINSMSTEGDVKSLYYDEIYFDEQDKPYVWVEDGGYITKFPIEIGLEGDIYTEVKTDINKQIVAPLTSDIEVKDGYKAKIVK
jgi:RND family efflux transporter MFP subunit